LPTNDVILAVLSAAIGLAGLLLVFSSSLVAKAATYETKLGKKFKTLARLVLIPVMSSFVLAWMGIRALQGSALAGYYLLTGLEITLLLTAVFATIAMWGSSS
jgi:hypothetical protein